MKVISIQKEKILFVLYLIIIVVGVLKTINDKNKESVSVFSMPTGKKIIVIDAGHGGFDPGMVKGKTEEKDINLEIAKKLQAYLEQSGSVVMMTRVEDKALASTKSGDMRNRKYVTNGSKADILVSIHQNSYPSASVRGVQVFYYESEKSKQLAQFIQDEVKRVANPSNKRDPKEGSGYYVLRSTTMPAVIVECGFLSNANDKYLLQQDEYQEKIAWGIYLGIIKYFEAGK